MGLIQFNNEQKLIQNEIRKFATAEIEPVADEIEKNGIFPSDIIKKLSDLGFLSLITPEQYDGSELDTTSVCIVIEELSKVCASVGAILVVNTYFIAFPLIKYGRESQKDTFLTRISKGENGGFICESDIESPDEKIKIKKQDSSYIISGNREFVLNGEAANFFLFPVTLSNGKGIYLLARERFGQGLVKQNVLGLRASGISSLQFKDLELKAEDLLISVEQGTTIYADMRDYANIGFSAVLIGIAQAALDVSVRYSKERVQFGRPICKFPMVQEMLAEMKVKIEAGRHLVYAAAAKCDQAENYALASKAARLFCNELAVFAGDRAVQIHGGYGYLRDYPVERYLRDAKALQVLEATQFMLKSDIAGELLQ